MFMLLNVSQSSVLTSVECLINRDMGLYWVSVVSIMAVWCKCVTIFRCGYQLSYFWQLQATLNWRKGMFPIVFPTLENWTKKIACTASHLYIDWSQQVFSMHFFKHTYNAFNDVVIRMLLPIGTSEVHASKLIVWIKAIQQKRCCRLKRWFCHCLLKQVLINKHLWTRSQLYNLLKQSKKSIITVIK